MVIIETITVTLDMKHIAVALLALCFSHLSASALDLGAKARSTPYDPYMAPVKSVLATVSGAQADMGRVAQLMRVGRGFRYTFSTPYTASLPNVTAARRAGDCKDKALWLINQINDESVRFVIGKARRSSSISHAWVVWQHEGRWWILDCTNNRDPIPADRVSRDAYIPMYSFGKDGAFEHAESATLFAKSGRRAVASN